MKKATGKVIRAFREHLGYKQEFVAHKLSTTVATLRNIENGRVSADLEKLYKLSLIFQVPIRDLLSLAIEIFENGNDESGLKGAVQMLRRK
jgi:transcriptional regulator with XRE-family HTH domain